MNISPFTARALFVQAIAIVMVACGAPAFAQPDPCAGKPASRAADEIQIEKWAKDGGGYAKVKPAAGKRFLVVTFPEAAAQVLYESKDFELTVPGHPGVIRPYGVTVWSRIDGPEAIKPEVAYLKLQLAKPRPISVAFEVPAGAKSATLRVKDSKTGVRW